MVNIPSAFVSYSYDNDEHKLWVLELATKLRLAGIDAILDQWELKAGDDIPFFMEKNIVKADYILMICTEKYVDKADDGRGGVGYEKMIVTADIMRSIDSNRIIPIIRQLESKKIPTFLRSKLYIDLSSKFHEEFGFDELIRTLHKSPLYKKPEIGSNPYSEEKISAPVRHVEPLHEIMRFISLCFNETTHHYISYSTMVERSSSSRLMLDHFLNKAEKCEYIYRDGELDVVLTEKGKEFILEHGLDQQDKTSQSKGEAIT